MCDRKLIGYTGYTSIPLGSTGKTTDILGYGMIYDPVTNESGLQLGELLSGCMQETSGHLCCCCLTGWWLSHPCEKYESQLGRIITYTMEK